MIDDEDSKVRRNLVVYSTVVIVVTFLGIQPMQILLKLLGVENGKIEPWRVWTVSAAVLMYLWLRFSTSSWSEAERLPARLRPGFFAVWQRIWARRLKLELSGDLFDGVIGNPSTMRIVEHASIVKALSNRFGDEFDELLASQSKIIWDTVEFSGARSPSMWQRSGVFGADLSYGDVHIQGNGSKQQLTTSGLKFRYKLSRKRWLALFLLTAPASMLTTSDGLQHNLPRLLALLAAGCIAWQFGCIAWVWWHSGTV